MPASPDSIARFRAYRNSRLYRSLTRTLREYNRRMVLGLHARGFEDFSPSFPAMLSNLDMAGTRIGVLAARGGVTRQAAGQLLREIERCGYVELRPSPDDARVTMVHFTARGRRLHAAVVELVERIEGEFAATITSGAFEQVRRGLLQIADDIDPGGALGAGDAAPVKPARAGTWPRTAKTPAASGAARQKRATRR
jgi:DNA-binding MarR family transcriptional regulator